MNPIASSLVKALILFLSAAKSHFICFNLKFKQTKVNDFERRLNESIIF